MQKEDLILTFDIGTTSNKCSLFTPSGAALASVTVSYKTRYPRLGWAEQNAEDYWGSVITGTRQLISQTSEYRKRIVGIGLSGHMNGMLPVDKHGDPVHPEIIHADSRSEQECAVIRRSLSDQDFFHITGNRIDSHLSLPKILWFKEAYPELYRKTAWILQSKDYIAGKLTGNPGSTDLSDASLTCALDLHTRQWSDSLLHAVQLDRNKFPRILRSHERVGGVCREAAGLLGLPVGLPVFAGGGDAACSTRGAGVSGMTTAMNYIGSSSWISLLASQPLLDERMRIQNFFDIDGEHYTVCGTVQSAGIALDWMIDGLDGGESSKMGRNYRRFEDFAASSGADAHGIIFLPYLMGERTPHWNQNLRGAFLGLSLGHGRNDIIRSVFEGIAFALRDVLQVFLENNLAVNELSLTGGGATSPFWNQLMSDIYRRPIKVPSSPKQATSLGAAIAAFVGSGLYTSYTDAAGAIQFGRTCSPDPVSGSVYDEVFEIYQSLYPTFSSLSTTLSKGQEGLYPIDDGNTNAME
ncbi:MAG: hypothetical protein HQ557_17305 [Bacteroidetes bacterium]|nr:hypothetical protein [Bacteroidota bacterium]